MKEELDEDDEEEEDDVWFEEESCCLRIGIKVWGGEEEDNEVELEEDGEFKDDVDEDEESVETDFSLLELLALVFAILLAIL